MLSMLLRRTGLAVLLIPLWVLKDVTPHAQGQPPTHVVDLVTAAAKTPVGDEVALSKRLRIPFGRQGRADHDPELPKPLVLQLVSTDRSSYIVGDEFVYELLISNRGSQPVEFPVSPHAGRFSDSTRAALAARGALTFQDAARGRQGVGAIALHGAPEVPGSIVVVGPSETLELRAPGQWYLQSSFPTSPARGWARELEVKAFVQAYSTKQALDLIHSENALTIHLKER